MQIWFVFLHELHELSQNILFIYFNLSKKDKLVKSIRKY
jgi:hypothetical protein